MPTWLIAILVTIVLAVLGGVYNVALSVSTVNDKLDRNCRILVLLDQDIRLHVIASEAKRHRGTDLAVFPAVSC